MEVHISRWWAWRRRRIWSALEDLFYHLEVATEASLWESGSQGRRVRGTPLSALQASPPDPAALATSDSYAERARVRLAGGWRALAPRLRLRLPVLFRRLPGLPPEFARMSWLTVPPSLPYSLAGPCIYYTYTPSACTRGAPGSDLSRPSKTSPPQSPPAPEPPRPPQSLPPRATTPRQHLEAASPNNRT